MNNIKELFLLIKKEVEEKESLVTEKSSLNFLLVESINNTLLEIRLNKLDVHDFYDATIINFSHLASKNKYSNDEIKEFISQFKNDIVDEEQLTYESLL